MLGRGVLAYFVHDAISRASDFVEEDCSANSISYIGMNTRHEWYRVSESEKIK